MKQRIDGRDMFIVSGQTLAKEENDAFKKGLLAGERSAVAAMNDIMRGYIGTVENALSEVSRLYRIEDRWECLRASYAKLNQDYNTTRDLLDTITEDYAVLSGEWSTAAAVGHEAEDLRRELEKLCEVMPPKISSRIQDVLDAVDARDSLAFVMKMQDGDLPGHIEPQPPAELVEFAKRHGVEVKQAAMRGRFYADVGRVVVLAGGDAKTCARLESVMSTKDGHTIDEALASLAAATVDDEAAHLEVCALIGDQERAFFRQFPRAALLTTRSGFCFPNTSAFATPWLARIACIANSMAYLQELEASNA
jgi:hypothetical protein